MGQAAWVWFLPRNKVPGLCDTKCLRYVHHIKLPASVPLYLLENPEHTKPSLQLCRTSEEAKMLHGLLKISQPSSSPWPPPLLITFCGLREVILAFEPLFCGLLSGTNSTSSSAWSSLRITWHHGCKSTFDSVFIPLKAVKAIGIRLPGMVRSG